MTAKPPKLMTTITETSARPSAGRQAYVPVLSSVISALRILDRPAEEAFLVIGKALGEASGVVGGIQRNFGGLVGRLEGSETQATADSLKSAIAQITTLADGGDGSLAVLVQLVEVVKGIELRLLALSKIAGEVRGLAISAKIQAAIIVAGDTDFTVFTSAIHGLGILATQAIEQACSRVRALALALDRAMVEARESRGDAAIELDKIQARLAKGLALLSRQHQAAASAAEGVGRHFANTAQRIVDCMTELQFNDTACQRIQHVREALAIIVELIGSGGEDDIDLLVGAICRLQSLQLTRTAEEYRQRGNVLIASLNGISTDALKILIEANNVTSAKSHHGNDARNESFIDALGVDITLAARRLNKESAAQERLKGILQTVSAGFAEMATDIEAIHSMDADMRVMGLNATFKCARLGAQGRALGVVAQELRSSSKRTEEVSSRIYDLLGSAMEMSKVLGAQEGCDGEIVSSLEKSIMNSLVNLGALSVTLDASLEKLRRDGNRVAECLGATAAKTDIHLSMHDSLTRLAAELAGIADLTGVGGADIQAMGERIRLLLAGQYTMQSERLIHQIFADCFSDRPDKPAAQTSAEVTSIDDLLF